jgi:hypothetical protein
MTKAEDPVVPAKNGIPKQGWITSAPGITAVRWDGLVHQTRY